MSQTIAPQADVPQRQWAALQLILKALAEATLVFFRKAGRQSLHMLKVGAGHARVAASRTVARIGAMRLPVSHTEHARVLKQLETEHARVLKQLEQFEVQAIASARSIECRETRTREFLALSRKAYEIGRDNQAFLKAALEELKEKKKHPYWRRKQERIFTAAQIACSVAGLAAMSGHADIGRDAYLLGQWYNGKVQAVDKKIGMACAFSDVARLLGAEENRVAWLATAMDLASGIDQKVECLGAVNFVARKMVVDRIPPYDNHLADRRFTVDTSAMAQVAIIEVAQKPAQPGSDSEFNLTE